MSTLRVKGNRRVVLKNPVDPTTWSAEETLRNVSIQLDENGNVIAIPTFSINPQTSPIPAGGSIGNVGILGNGSTNIATVRGTNSNGEALTGDNTVSTTSLIGLLSQGVGTQNFLEEAQSFISVDGTAASTTTTVTILATGGASKKYRLFSLGIQAGFGAGVAKAQIIEHTSATVLLEVIGQAATAGYAALSMPLGVSGVLQPTANNGLDLVITSAAVTSSATATVIYSAAR